jgi:hypothetical protein
MAPYDARIAPLLNHDPNELSAEQGREQPAPVVFIFCIKGTEQFCALIEETAAEAK